MFVPQSLSRLIRAHWLLFVIIIFISPLFIFRLISSPNSWYDEGLNINAAQTLINTGKFGLTTFTGIRFSDPAIQTGLPLLILMGLTGKLFVNSLFAIRLVMVIFGNLTLISLYALTYRLFGRFAALLAVLMLLTAPVTDTTSTLIFLSRQFLGEVPAVLCISLGCHLSLRNRPQVWSSVLIGVLWGIAIILKSQVLLVLSVTVVVWVTYRIITRQPDKYYWLLTAVVMFSLYGLDTLWRSSMAGPLLADNMATLREGIGIHILPFRGLKNLREISTLGRLSMAVFALLAIRYIQKDGFTTIAAYQKQPNPMRTTHYFIMLLAAIWMIWFAFISIGWGRYSFVGSVFVYVLLSGVLSVLRSRLKLPTHTSIYAGLLVVALVMTYMLNLSDIRNTTGDDFFKIVEDIKTEIPADARIVTIEWAADNFVPQHFIYPSTHTINLITENAFINRVDDYAYDSVSDCPQYVLLGSLRLDTTVLKDALSISKPEPLFEEGIYKLYEVNTSQLPTACKTSS